MKVKYLNKFLIVAIILMAIMLCVSIFKVGKWYIDSKKTNEKAEEIQELVDIKETDGESVNPPEDKFDPYWDFIKLSLISVDFTKLIKSNSDTVGWIYVKNSNINYPVVQANDNDYYLNRGFDKQKNEAGWVFMDYRNNSKDFNKNTIVYAHSRIDKSMFGTLKNVTKEEWFNNKDNHIIKFSTPKENTMWMVFSSYTVPAESYYIKTDFSSDAEYNKWLNTMKKRSIFDYKTCVSTNDKILTLSSCYNTNGIRVVVHAKLIKKEIRS